MLSYASFGPADAPTLVLCHGLAANGMQFIADAEHFAASGFRVLVPDLRGHGRSHAPTVATPESFSIATMAGDMLAMLDHAAAPAVHWVGNSLGGIIALQLAGTAPHRLTSITLFGTSFALNLPRAVGPLVPLLYKTLGPDLLSRIAAATTTRYKPARPLIAAMTRSFSPTVGAAIAAQIRHYDLTANALAYPGPMLILVGGRDTSVNFALQPALKRIGPRANWTVINLPNGGHCANLDATDHWRAALGAFLGQPTTGSPIPPAPTAADLR